MEKLLSVVKTAIWEAVYASGRASNSADEAFQTIQQMEKENALFKRKYAIYAKRQSSMSSSEHWQVIKTVDSLTEAHAYMRRAGEETFCQEILAAK